MSKPVLVESVEVGRDEEGHRTITLNGEAFPYHTARRQLGLTPAHHSFDNDPAILWVPIAVMPGVSPDLTLDLVLHGGDWSSQVPWSTSGVSYPPDDQEGAA